MATYDQLIAKAKELKAAGRMDDARRVAQIAIKQRDSAQTAPSPSPAPTSTPARSWGETLYQNVIGRGEPDTFGEKLGQQTQGVIAGAMRGTAGLVGLPGTINDLIDSQVDKVWPRPRNAPGNFLSGASLNRGMSNITGGRSDYVAPGTLGKYGSAVGEFLPGMAVGGGGLAKIVGNTLASAIPSEALGQATEGTAAEPYARLAGALLGPTGVAGAKAAFRKGPPPAPSLNDLKVIEKKAWGIVDDSALRLSPQSTEKLSANVLRKMTAKDMDPMLDPKAARMTALIEERAGRSPTVSGVENLRRKAEKAVASSTDASEASLGAIMKKEIADYLDGLAPSDFVTNASGPEVSAVINALKRGRGTTQKIKKTEQILEMADKGEMAASTSGTGGNFMNTTRQQFKALLQDKKKLRGFSKDEIEMMRSIVDGNPTVNALRWASRFSPTAGMLPGAMSAGLGGAALYGGNPTFAAIPAVGLAAKIAGEHLTKRQVNVLLDALKRGGKAPPKPPLGLGRSLSSALLAQQSGPR